MKQSYGGEVLVHMVASNVSCATFRRLSMIQRSSLDGPSALGVFLNPETILPEHFPVLSWVPRLQRKMGKRTLQLSCTRCLTSPTKLGVLPVD